MTNGGWQPDRYQAASNHLLLIDEDWAQPIKPAGDFGLQEMPVL